jgi:hypothetical protein
MIIERATGGRQGPAARIDHMSGGADNADYRLGDGLGALSLQPFSVMTGFPGRSP